MQQSWWDAEETKTSGDRGSYLLGLEEKLDNFYVKKPDIDSVIEFNKSIQDAANEIFNKENIIRK